MSTMFLLLWLTNPQAPTATSPAAPVEVEARCADGSLLRLTLLQPALQVQTRYGLLTVPVRDLRKVELGLHFPDGVEVRVQDAVAKLASSSFREREAAVAELVALGEYAYPLVYAAVKSKDQEVALRAYAVLEKLRETVPADRLRLDWRDRLETAEFPIAGRIAGVTLKARSAYFGVVELRLSDVRSLRTLAVPVGEMVVDAAKYGSPGSVWFDTGIDLEPGRKVLLTASGEVDLWPATPGQFTCTAGGYRNAGTVQGTSYHAGTLLGKIGEHGKVFVVGERLELTPEVGGRLWLSIAPSPWNNASAGSYKVKVGGP